MKLSTALSALVAVLTLAVSASAQGTPDCQWTDTFTGATGGISRQNTSTPCVAFRVTYQAVGMTALSIELEGAQATGGPWTPFPASAIVQGTNPLTNATSATLVATGTVYYPFVRTAVTVFTPTGASGTITARIYGYKGTSAANISGTGAIINPMTTLGDIIYENATPQPARLPGNTTTAELCLTQTGTGTASAAPIWTQCPSAGLLTYYHTNTASSIATYFQQTAPPYSPKTTLSFAALATGIDTLRNWATNAGIPNLLFIPAGAYSCHLHGLRTGGGTVNLQCQFVEVDAAGVDIAVIGTSEASVALGTAEAEYNLFYADGNTYTLTSTASRIVCRVQAVVSGSSPTVQLFVGGTADAHMSLPSNTVDSSTFVPYTGATANLTLGPHILTGGDPTAVSATGQGLYIPPGGITNGFATAASTANAGLFGFSEQGTAPTGISAVALAHDAATPTGVTYISAHAGNIAGPGLIGSGANLALLDNGNVTGWSTGYALSFAGNFDAGSATFLHVAGFDCGAASFVNAGTGDNACYHSLQAPVGGKTIYFMLEEGGLPSKLTGTLAIGGGTASKAACFKADGITLGVCTSVVGATGGCTCP